MTPEEWRDRVGLAVERRRGELRLSRRGLARLAGFSEGLLRQIETGERVLAKGVTTTVNPKPATRAALCRALGWADDGIDVLAAGGHPASYRPPVIPPNSGEGALQVQVWELAEQVGVLAERLDALVQVAVEQIPRLDATVAEVAALRAEVQRLSARGVPDEPGSG